METFLNADNVEESHRTRISPDQCGAILKNMITIMSYENKLSTLQKYRIRDLFAFI